MCGECNWPEKKNMWINIKDRLPKDDQTILVINNKIEMLPVKAYYCDGDKEFFSLENIGGTIHPLSVTHWMTIPKRPE